MRAVRPRPVALNVASGAVISITVLNGTCRLTPDEALGLAFRLAHAAEQANTKRRKAVNEYPVATE